MEQHRCGKKNPLGLDVFVINAIGGQLTKVHLLGIDTAGSASNYVRLGIAGVGFGEEVQSRKRCHHLSGIQWIALAGASVTPNLELVGFGFAHQVELVEIVRAVILVVGETLSRPSLHRLRVGEEAIQNLLNELALLLWGKTRKRWIVSMISQQALSLLLANTFAFFEGVERRLRGHAIRR